jgi:hypothetical protein
LLKPQHQSQQPVTRGGEVTDPARQSQKAIAHLTSRKQPLLVERLHSHEYPTLQSRWDGHAWVKDVGVHNGAAASGNKRRVQHASDVAPVRFAQHALIPRAETDVHRLVRACTKESGKRAVGDAVCRQTGAELPARGNVSNSRRAHLQVPRPVRGVSPVGQFGETTQARQAQRRSAARSGTSAA